MPPIMTWICSVPSETANVGCAGKALRRGWAPDRRESPRKAYLAWLNSPLNGCGGRAAVPQG